MHTFLNVKRYRVQLAIGLRLIFFSIFITFAQETEFVIRSGTNLLLNNRPFYVTGVNCYFLQNLAAYGDTFHIDEVFQEAKQIGVTVIRTWGFFDYSDSTNPAVIQYLPGRFNESGLKALDLVIAKAQEYSIRLIIPLVNNWEDYGGMNQYVRWYAQSFPKQKAVSEKIEQRIITGAEGRYYRYRVSGSYTHDDFYSNTTIVQWYKEYISTILNRTNTITKIIYKDEPIILAWELANEPRSSDRSGMKVTNWMHEISTFIKTADQNHLISSGEEGLDITNELYSDEYRYNDQAWLFDGSGGVSFQQNLKNPSIDIGSIHCYPESWHLSGNQGVQWLSDHNRIANQFQKPLLLGEVGKFKDTQRFFKSIFNEALYGTTAGVLIWQFVYDGRLNNDGFAFYYPADHAVWSVVQFYSEQFDQKRSGNLVLPTFFQLLPNYPNPFNNSTLIPYNLSITAHVEINVYNTAGQRIINLIDREQLPGYHLALFDGFGLSSGAYYVHLTANGNTQSSKVLLLK